MITNILRLPNFNIKPSDKTPRNGPKKKPMSDPAKRSFCSTIGFKFNILQVGERRANMILYIRPGTRLPQAIAMMRARGSLPLLWRGTQSETSGSSIID